MLGKDQTISTRENNFDLLRLFASAQVAIVHICDHLEINMGLFLELLKYFPGVPIFFFISGFLISQSFSRQNNLKIFYRNRFLRIYPALLVCLIVSIFLASLFKQIPWASTSFIGWLLAQATIVQFYNPQFLRDFGTGVLNGSLWTIPIEIQFYIALPIIWTVARKIGVKFIYLVLIISFILHFTFINMFYGAEDFFVKLLQVTIIPWLAFFMAGVLTAWHWGYIENIFRGKFLKWMIYFIIATIIIKYLEILEVTGNRINGISAIFLFLAIISAAFTYPTLSQRLLRGNDISYGLYLYHMPLVNVYLATEAPRTAFGAVMVFLAAVAAACLSWWLVERPALNLRKIAKRSAAVDAPST
ncbi:acyltransferase [Bosea sp. (in: a-proteobacteria)]|uniref:acyltransferase family protein n=1 Tax=Bosea sp. (in: a-proteobacteria) TaxID=1871050 RepID=UPI002639A7E5|nr:acyltransferase [Bosea sp. (in: a-proteobacteria)]MCO5091036.1 acyltransferase [Bosea sp. (in: a-proteobacteria)]